jgi:hypothetical protein
VQTETKQPKKTMNWLMFVLLTVVCWGLYGVFLHMGQEGMADKVAGRYKAFLFVGVAYFLVAVLAPLAVLMMHKGETAWSFPAKGMWLSLLAGTLGAVGAFGVLLALGSGIKAGAGPAVVMSIVFAGAPIVNAVVSISMHKGGWGAIPWQFVLGIVLAATGGCLVTLNKPKPVPHPVPTPPAAAESSE